MDAKAAYTNSFHTVVEKIISGAQTGADRAGLDAGLALGLQVGGWIPLGGRTDDGNDRSLIARYNLTEHPSYSYLPRTEQNVIDSEGTAWFGDASPGYYCTRASKTRRKPFEVITSATELRAFVRRYGIKVLNVAGNRERVNPGIYAFTYSIIIEAFDREAA